MLFCPKRTTEELLRGVSIRELFSHKTGFNPKIKIRPIVCKCPIFPQEG